MTDLDKLDKLHSDLLNKQMILSRRLQDLNVELQHCQQESLKVAGRIDLVEELKSELSTGQINGQ
jgi:hypothetical protein